MNDHFSLQNIDSLIFQFALQTRELTHEKNELNKQIKVCKADIAERKSYIESMEEKIKKLEEEIRVKQDIVIHNKENAKSMKATNSLLLQYEQTLKAELNSRQASYNHDMWAQEVSEERIASYRKILQSHKEYYYQNPLAQKLLMLQAEKEEIECRIKAVDEQVTIKQKELDRVTDPAANCSSAETLIESISGQQPITELEKQLDPLIVESSDLSNSFLHLSQTKNGHTVSVKANEGDILEEKRVQNNKTFSNYSEEASSELGEKTRSEEMYTSEQEKKTKAQDQVLELVTPASEINEPVEDKVEERVILDENQAPNNEDNEGLTGFPQSTNPSSPAKITAASSNPTFPFNFSPASSPHQGTSVRKSPTFLFSLISDPSTPSFSGFDVGSSQNEDTSFTFHSSFFSDKKAAVSKVLNSPGFLFDQSDQSEDFQFDFTSKSPQATKKDNNRDEFPFSLNF